MKNLLSDVAETDGVCLTETTDLEHLELVIPTDSVKPTYLFMVVTAEEKEQVIAVFDNVVSAAAFSGVMYEKCILHRTRMMEVGKDYLQYVVSPPAFPSEYGIAQQKQGDSE